MLKKVIIRTSLVLYGLVAGVVGWAAAQKSAEGVVAGVSEGLRVLREIAGTLSSWPVVVLILVLILLLSESGGRHLGSLFRRVRSVKALGAELEFSDQGARDLHLSAEDAFSSFRSQVNREFDRLAHQYGISELTGKVLDKAFQGGLGSDVRATVYVEDMLFAEALYQMIDYYPKGGGRGRIFSFRKGIIGRVWRSEESDREVDVPTSAELVKRYGMTKQEAMNAGFGRRAFMCILIQHADKRVGLLYLDAPSADALPEKIGEPPQSLVSAIESACKGTGGLAESLSLIGYKTRELAPSIKIYG